MNMRIACALTVLVGVCLTVYAEDPRLELPKFDFSKMKVREVSGIVDGDSVELVLVGTTTMTATLAGVAAKNKYEEDGKKACDFLCNMLKGESVYIMRPKSGEKGKPCRKNAYYLFRAPDGLFVNLEVVRQGYGIASLSESTEHRDVFDHYQKDAIESGRGQWAKLESKSSATADKPAKKSSKSNFLSSNSTSSSSDAPTFRFSSR